MVCLLHRRHRLGLFFGFRILSFTIIIFGLGEKWLFVFFLCVCVFVCVCVWGGGGGGGCMVWGGEGGAGGWYLPFADNSFGSLSKPTIFRSFKNSRFIFLGIVRIGARTLF